MHVWMWRYAMAFSEKSYLSSPQQHNSTRAYIEWTIYHCIDNPCSQRNPNAHTSIIVYTTATEYILDDRAVLSALVFTTMTSINGYTQFWDAFGAVRRIQNGSKKSAMHFSICVFLVLRAKNISPHKIEYNIPAAY